MDLGKICETILDMCVEPPQPSVDNMTILLVRFKHAAQAPARPGQHRKATAQSGTGDDLQGKSKGKDALEVDRKAAAPHRRSFWIWDTNTSQSWFLLQSLFYLRIWAKSGEN